MCSFRFTINPHYRQDVEKKLKVAQDLGDRREINRLLAVLAIIKGHSFEDTAEILSLDGGRWRHTSLSLCSMGSRGGHARSLRDAPPN
jgi:hypothetical protein